MFKNFVFFVVLAVVGCAFAESELSEADREFVEAIKVGFDRDLTGVGQAEWLGFGQVEVLHIEAHHPDLAFVTGAEGTETLSGNAPFSELVALRSEKSAEVQSAVYAAWLDEDGTLYVALSVSLSGSERMAVEGSTEHFNDWFVDVRNSMGPSRISSAWIYNSSKTLTLMVLSDLTEGQTGIDLFKQVQLELEELKFLKF